MKRCTICRKLRDVSGPRKVCQDCCPHEYSWGVCKHCGRTWGVEVKVRKREEERGER